MHRPSGKTPTAALEFDGFALAVALPIYTGPGSTMKPTNCQGDGAAIRELTKLCRGTFL